MIIGVLLLLTVAGMIIAAVRKGMTREVILTVLALAVLVAGTRVSLATGWWGVVFWPLTTLGTGATLIRGARG